MANEKSKQEISTPYLPKLPKFNSKESRTKFIAFSLENTPEIIITRAVKVHKTIVSKNTSKIPKQPWECAFSAFDDACAQGAVPLPASFDKSPRLTPYRMALVIPKPRTPKEALFKLKALSKITLNA